MLIAALAAPRAADASTYRLQAGGDWTNPANWVVVEGPAGAGYPNLPGDVAVLVPLGGSEPPTVTIPDLVTVSIGRLIVGHNEFSPTIARLGSGLLVFDNGGEDATIEVGDGTGRAMTLLTTAVRLNANLVVAGSVGFSGGISETGGARGLTLRSGPNFILGPAANSYTGVTTVLGGSLSIAPAGPLVRIAGSLVVGDGDLTNGRGSATILPESIATSTDVLVRRDGQLFFARAGAVAILQEIADLTVEESLVHLWPLSQLRVANVNMLGGLISMSNDDNQFILGGTLTATSSAWATATIKGAAHYTDQLTLTAAAHDIVVADGPLATDLLIQAPIVGISFGLNKLGAGTAVFTSANTYTGATTVTEGTLLLNGTQQGSAVTVAGGTLGGRGIIGSVTATSGSVSPGDPSSTAILTTGNVTLAAGAQYVVGINGTTAGAGHDQLLVAGLVDLGGATLVVNTPGVLPHGATFTIIENDLNDPTAGQFASLPEGAILTSSNGNQFQITYSGGTGNDVVLTNVTPVTYFLSEGATGSFFDEDVLIANPNSVAAPVTMTFFLPGGGTVVEQRTVPPQSRITVRVDDIIGLEATSPSVQVTSDNSLTLGVERTMFWDSTHYAGHTANAAPRAQRQWYFAEGAQGGFFNTYVQLGNASASPVDVQLTFLREDDTPVTQSVTLPPFSRDTVYAGENAALVDKSFGIIAEAAQPFTAERAMYFASTPATLWGGGHVNAASAAPSTSWFHAEGASGTFFTTFVLMSNPQDSLATVTLKFLLSDGGPPIEGRWSIPAKQRVTVNPAALGLPRLQHAAFSTVVTSDVPIVSERVMYWPKGTMAFGEGHASSGVVQTANSWVLAEGRVGGPEAYTTYVQLANPGNAASSVTVTFLRENGTPVTQNYVVAANSRFNIDVGGMVTELQNESFGVRVDVTAGPAIAVERSMYWNANGVFWSGGTNALAEIVPQ